MTQRPCVKPASAFQWRVAFVAVLGVVLLPWRCSAAECALVDHETCVYNDPSLPNIDWDLDSIMGPPSQEMTTFNRGANTDSYDTVYFDFCRQASGGTGQGSASGNGDQSGNGDGSGDGSGGGHITDAIEAYCSEQCGFAYAINSGDNSCYGLGTSLSITRLDAANPAKGIQVSYTGSSAGSAASCPDGNSLTISLRCSPETSQADHVTKYDEYVLPSCGFLLFAFGQSALLSCTDMVGLCELSSGANTASRGTRPADVQRSAKRDRVVTMIQWSSAVATASAATITTWTQQCAPVRLAMGM